MRFILLTVGRGFGLVYQCREMTSSLLCAFPSATTGSGVEWQLDISYGLVVGVRVICHSVLNSSCLLCSVWRLGGEMDCWQLFRLLFEVIC